MTLMAPSRAFRTIILLLILSYQNVTSELEQYTGICANSDACGDRCEKIYEMFQRENLLSVWAERYESIARTLQEYNVKVSLEIGET